MDREPPKAARRRLIAGTFTIEDLRHYWLLPRLLPVIIAAAYGRRQIPRLPRLGVE